VKTDFSILFSQANTRYDYAL